MQVEVRLFSDPQVDLDDDYSRPGLIRRYDAPALMATQVTRELVKTIIPGKTLYRFMDAGREWHVAEWNGSTFLATLAPCGCCPLKTAQWSGRVSRKGALRLARLVMNPQAYEIAQA